MAVHGGAAVGGRSQQNARSEQAGSQEAICGTERRDWAAKSDSLVYLAAPSCARGNST
jgi:hypothetical protein